jgi:hypothetical protein
MAPVVHGLENKYGQQIKFTFLDIDDLATQPFQETLGYARQWRPYILLLDPDGQIITREDGSDYIWIGVIPGETLESAIVDALNRFGSQ